MTLTSLRLFACKVAPLETRSQIASAKFALGLLQQNL